MRFNLTPVEARVLGCLIEKEITTPEYYPLTVNALIAACNQKSNRDPVMALDEKTVSEALDELRYRDQLVWQVSLSGSRVPRFKHDLPAKIRFSPVDLAVICELILRGPQTAGELRVHVSRMHKDVSLANIETALRDLGDWGGEVYVVQLPPGPGRREPRYAQQLTGDLPPNIGQAADAAEPSRMQPVTYVPVQDRIATLEDHVARLTDEIAGLREQFEGFRKQFE